MKKKQKRAQRLSILGFIRATDDVGENTVIENGW